MSIFEKELEKYATEHEDEIKKDRTLANKIINFENQLHRKKKIIT
jgi:hypothetical protein